MYYTNGAKNCRRPLEITQKKLISQTERFRPKVYSVFRNTYVLESRFSTVKQVNFKNRNRMADETPATKCFQLIF